MRTREHALSCTQPIPLHRYIISGLFLCPVSPGWTGILERSIPFPLLQGRQFLGQVFFCRRRCQQNFAFGRCLGGWGPPQQPRGSHTRFSSHWSSSFCPKQMAHTTFLRKPQSRPHACLSLALRPPAVAPLFRPAAVPVGPREASHRMARTSTPHCPRRRTRPGQRRTRLGRRTARGTGAGQQAGRLPPTARAAPVWEG